MTESIFKQLSRALNTQEDTIHIDSQTPQELDALLRFTQTLLAWHHGQRSPQELKPLVSPKSETPNHTKSTLKLNDYTYTLESVKSPPSLTISCDKPIPKRTLRGTLTEINRMFFERAQKMEADYFINHDEAYFATLALRLFSALLEAHGLPPEKGLHMLPCDMSNPDSKPKASYAVSIPAESYEQLRDAERLLPIMPPQGIFEQMHQALLKNPNAKRLSFQCRNHEEAEALKDLFKLITEVDLKGSPPPRVGINIQDNSLIITCNEGFPLRLKESLRYWHRELFRVPPENNQNPHVIKSDDFRSMLYLYPLCNRLSELHAGANTSNDIKHVTAEAPYALHIPSKIYRALYEKEQFHGVLLGTPRAN